LEAVKIKRAIWRKQSDNGLVWEGGSEEPCFLEFPAGEDVADEILLKAGLIAPKKSAEAPTPAKKAVAAPQSKMSPPPSNK
jgi:hypothetical protein